MEGIKIGEWKYYDELGKLITTENFEEKIIEIEAIEVYNPDDDEEVWEVMTGRDPNLGTYHA